MRTFKTLLIAVLLVPFGLSGCATMEHFTDGLLLWHGDTVHVTPYAAHVIATDATALLNTHYPRDTTFEIVRTRHNLVTNDIIAKLLGMGYAVDLVYRSNKHGPVVPGEVPMNLNADNMGFKDIVRISVNVDTVSAQRIYTSAGGRPTGPWTVTVRPHGRVIVGPVSAPGPSYGGSN